MKSYMNKKIAKNLYISFMLIHLSVLFSSILFEQGNAKLYVAVQITAIINTILVTSLCLWLTIESAVILSKLKRSFNEIKSLKWFTRGNFLGEFFTLILITAPVFISTELQAFDYIWKDNRVMINLEALFIFTITSTVVFSIIIIALNIAFSKLKIVIKLNRINNGEQIFFKMYQNINKPTLSTQILTFASVILVDEKIEFKEVLEKNTFIQCIVNWKRSLNLKNFKKGVTPPHLIF
ncbi:hypothetical protein [Spiroplasma monobiae]|uniref:Transmembrane protein n=1 Tax=Spiroplasma monobiae MQ-1 TaxID=1336748 RepID=A0A2K9LX81_SPISQ|nr:hypothetical protein [Spiroplasma monobiae]AUM62965.1 hypothetical protein SMONO_v1c07160 [Spiroplasma monobiae MQ-1]